MPSEDTPSDTLQDDLQDELRAAWHRFVDRVAPLRPDLHRYCRRLTRNVWEAEDLAQEALLRAFGHLGFLGQPVDDPRSYLLRTATNVFIDGLRRREAESRMLEAIEPPGRPGPTDRGADVRLASERLLERLSPQERAAVVLKDAFEMSLDEIAGILSTTRGAVKSALHRGRARLAAPPEEAPPVTRPPSDALVDAFIARYRAGDVRGLVDLLVDGGSAENVGCGIQYGPRVFEGTKHFFHAAVHGHDEWPEVFRPEAVRVDRATYLGEPLILAFATRGGREALEQVMRLEEADGKLARLRGYAFCPETMREVGAALGLPVRTGLYRYPTPAPGKYYGDG